MIGFGQWLQAKGSFVLSKNASSWLMAVDHIHPSGAVIYLQQVKRSNGTTLPRFGFSLDDDGIIQQEQLPVKQIVIPLASPFFDTLRAEYVSQFNLSYALSPESVAAGATFADMTDATDADVANVASVNQMRILLGISAL